MRLSKILFMAAMAIGASVWGDSIGVDPDKLDQFVFTSDKLAVLTFKISPTNQREIGYDIQNYMNEHVLSGKVTIQKEKFSIKLKLPDGYYTIRFNNKKRTGFGLFALPEVKSPNSYFAMDAWLTGGKEYKEKVKRPALIRILQRCGIAQVRDRIVWHMMNTGEKQWNFNPPRREFLKLAQQYNECGVKQLVAFDHAPKYLGGAVHKYPENIIGAVKAFSLLVNKLSFDYFAMESWNEPDIGFSGNKPADQYMGFTKLMTAALIESKADFPLVGGVFAHHNSDFLNTAIENGLLECSDVISFHCYKDIKLIPSIVKKYKESFAVYGYKNVRMWVTEAGTFHMIGRGSLGQWMFDSGVDVVTKSLMFKENGIEKIFPFVYVHWSANGKLQGFLGSNDSPRRNLSAYITLRRIIGDKKLIGKLSKAIFPQDNYVFDTDDDRYIVVAVNGKGNVKNRIKTSLKFDVLTGIDGRKLVQKMSDSIPFNDGVVYGLTGKKNIQRHIIPIKQTVQTPVKEYKRKSNKFDFNIISIGRLNEKIFVPRSSGYTVLNSADKKVIKTAINNVGNKVVKLDYILSISNSKGKKILLAQKEDYILSAKSELIVEKELTPEELKSLLGPCIVRLEVMSNGKKVLPLVMNLWFEMSLQNQLEQFKYKKKLNLSVKDNWSMLKHTLVKPMLEISEKGFKLDAKMPTGKGCWIFPKYSVPETPDFSKYNGMVLRLKNSSDKMNKVYVLLWEKSNSSYLPASSIIPSDKKWHVVYIPFDSLVINPGGKSDNNEKLDLESVQKVSIGITGNRGLSNMIEVSDWYLVK